jgi:PAS domain S-box-containing protein
VKRANLSTRALVLAPRGRDAAIAVELLGAAGIDAATCPSVPSLIDEIHAGAAFVIVTEEVLATAVLVSLAAWLVSQEEWSDLPFILLTNKGGGLERNPAAQRFLDVLGNVTFLERPFHPTTFISLARSALRNRRRQYEARARLDALQAGEERYRSLFEAIDAGFCIIEMLFDESGKRALDYQFIEVNPAFEKQTGLLDAQGRWMRELAPDHEQLWFDIYGQVALTGEAVRFEERAQELERYYDVHAYRVGHPMQRRVAILFNDITARRQFEERLRESEDHYRHTVELNPQVTWTARPDGQLDHVAQRWFEWTGTTGLGETWAEGLHEDDRERTFAVWGHSVATGEPYDIEHRVKMRDGHYRWARSRAFPRLDHERRMVKWYGTTQDIHEQKLAEARLAASEARFQAIANSVDQMIWSTLPDGYHDYYNQRWYDYTGVPEGSTNGEGWNAIFHSDDQDRAWATWRQSLSTGEPYRIEYRLRHHSGQYRWVLGRAQCVRDEKGAITRWYGTCTDIQDIVEAREVLSRSREELEGLVAERTAKLIEAEEQLRQAQKMEALGKLTGGVAHDFNNLLTPITGALDMLQRRYAEDDSRAARLIDGALQSAERAKILVQRLLGFARQQSLETRAVDLAALLDGMRDLIASSVGPGIELRIERRDDLPAAVADLNQLELAILNLCVNARDAMPDGGTLSLVVERAVVGPRSSPKLAHGLYIRLSVIDTGTGMDEATLRRAVDPFFSTKEQGKGTGLGLSMVSGLMAQLGGGLDLSSAVGEGTRIDLYFAVAETRDEVGGPREGERVLVVGRPLAILLVDDEDIVRAGTAEMLRDLGHTVAQASGGLQALHMLEDDLQVDVLVSDYRMPGMDGAALARRAREAKPNLPVLIITGYAGSDGVGLDLPKLAKPFRQADLAGALNSLFEPSNVVRMRKRTPL